MRSLLSPILERRNRWPGCQAGRRRYSQREVVVMIPGLFEGGEGEAGDVPLGPGAVLLAGFARRFEEPLLTGLDQVVKAAPVRHMVTPGGREMSVAMTNCGSVGWVTDRAGYRYDAIDPASGRPWPPMPEAFEALAAEAARRG